MFRQEGETGAGLGVESPGEGIHNKVTVIAKPEAFYKGNPRAQLGNERNCIENTLDYCSEEMNCRGQREYKGYIALSLHSMIPIQSLAPHVVPYKPQVPLLSKEPGIVLEL